MSKISVNKSVWLVTHVCPPVSQWVEQGKLQSSSDPVDGFYSLQVKRWKTETGKKSCQEGDVQVWWRREEGEDRLADFQSNLLRCLLQKTANLRTSQAATEAEKRRNQLLTGSLRDFSWAQINWLTAKLLKWTTTWQNRLGRVQHQPQDQQQRFLFMHSYNLFPPFSHDRVHFICFLEISSCYLERSAFSPR